MTKGFSDYLVFVDESGCSCAEQHRTSSTRMQAASGRAGGLNATPEKQKAPTHPPSPVADRVSPVHELYLEALWMNIGNPILFSSFETQV
jgi:hypothetical protein